MIFGPFIYPIIGAAFVNIAYALAERRLAVALFILSATCLALYLDLMNALCGTVI